MTERLIYLSDIARSDARDAVPYYLVEASPNVAQEFADSLRSVIQQIKENPGAGSPHYAELLGQPGLRHRPCGKFPYLFFYLDSVETIEA